jgi:hypothetical protein
MRDEKQAIEQEIGRARDHVGERIDELDRRLRSTLDIKSQAAEHAPQIIAGGAVLGFLVGFGFPKAVKVLLKLGIPIAAVTFAAKKYAASRNGDGAEPYDASEL